MKKALRRVFRLAGMSTFLAILASPLSAPRLALGSSLAPHQIDKLLCLTTTLPGIAYDPDGQRCVFGGGGCDLHYQ